MLHPFNSCIGIEMISNLHNIALKTQKDYDENIQSMMRDHPNLFPNHYIKNQIYIPKLNLIEGDFFEHDLHEASVVFANSTCFSKFVMDEIFNKSMELPKGTILINTSVKMPKKMMENWQFITPFKRLMSWGLGKVFIYRKK